MSRASALLSAAGASVALGCLLAAARPASAQSAPIASTDTNTAGIVAEVTECKRKEGVLTVKVRFRNTTDKEIRFYVISSRNYDAYYLSAANKKYFILRDSEKTPLAPQPTGGGDVGASIEPGASYTWWAKYPAPPADVKSVSLYMPVSPPLDDVPVTDL